MRGMSRLRGRPLLAVIAAGVMAYGAVSAASAAAPRHTVNISVTIGVAAPAVNLWLPFIANAEGYFTQEHLNVTVKEIPSSQLLAAVGADAIPFGSFSSPQPDIGGFAAPIKWLADWATRSDFVMVAAPGITSLADLKGKKIGASSEGSSTEILAEAMAGQGGLTPSDYTMELLGTTTNDANAFIAGSLDAMATDQPDQSLLLEGRKGSSVIGNVSKYGWNTGLAANSTWVGEHPNITVEVLTALNKALAYWWGHPAAVEAILESGLTLTPPNADGGYKQSLETFTKTLIPVSKATETGVLAIIHKYGYPHAVASSWYTLTDPKYVNEVLKKAKK